ncbi:hypothetical protein ZWY2020_033290 [Hordeum vulgare]|nr:hypothetical protein ZWY2020_033290 [Hordeum vulgare]
MGEPGTQSCAAGGVLTKDCRDEHPLMALPPPPYHAQVPIFGVDCLLTFLVRYPDRILIRGNHEQADQTSYGVYDECLRKYGSVNVWRCCREIFDYLSLSALIENKIFNVHVGLSLAITALDQVLFHLEKDNQELKGDLKDMYINTAI